MKDGGVLIIEDFVIDLLNIKKDFIDDITYSNIKGNSEIFVRLKKLPMQCPHCKRVSSSTNGTQVTTLKNPMFHDRPCVVHLRKYRYKCLTCNCTFMDTYGLSEKGKSMSHSVALRIMNMAKDEHVTFLGIANELDISITTVISIFMKFAPKSKSRLPEVICIDEVYLGRSSRKKYAVVLLDFNTSQIIDFIYGRSVEDCIRGLDKYSRTERKQVKYLSTDMYQGFLRLSKSMFPDAKICIDSFHVISLIITEMDKVLRSIMNEHDRNSIEYYLLKQHRHLLLQNSNKIDWYKRNYNRRLCYYISNQKLLEMINEIDYRILEMYDLKEDYIKFNRFYTANETYFCNLIERFSNSKISGFRKISRTLKQNYEGIMNSFTRINGRRISNGPIESRNNTIKLILRNSAGYRNFEHLRTRVIYVINNKKS